MRTYEAECSHYDMSIPQYSMRGEIMRRKWKKANVNSTLWWSSSTLGFYKMFSLVCTISTVNLLISSCAAAGHEIYGKVPGGVIPVLDSNSLSSTSSQNNATSADFEGLVGSYFSWVVERKECDKLDEGCFCESRSRNWTVIRCRCDNDTQVRNESIK